MSKKFDLVSNYKPAGDQPRAIEEIVKGLNDGLLNQTLLGVTGSGKTFTMANVIQEVQRPAIVMAHNKTLAAQLYGEFKEYFPNNAVEYFVSYYDYYQPEAYVPTTDIYIEKDASINEHIEQMRLSATKAIMERRDVVIVASVSAIYGLGDPQSYLQMVLHLDRGDEVDQRTLLRRLAELQYQRNEVEFKRSMYRVRGDVIDVFPADSEKEALRIELFGNEIDAIHPEMRICREKGRPHLAVCQLRRGACAGARSQGRVRTRPCERAPAHAPLRSWHTARCGRPFSRHIRISGWIASISFPKSSILKASFSESAGNTSITSPRTLYIDLLNSTSFL